MSKQYYIYIATNPGNTTLYTGVTNDLIHRVWEHKQKLVSSFISKYNIIKLIYYEVSAGINVAIAREKQIKGGSRGKKISLIKGMNPKFDDLYNSII